MPKFAWNYILNRKILPKRKFTSAAKYESVWTPEGSPLIVYQGRLAAKLQSRIDDQIAKGVAPQGTMVRCAMSYSGPSFETTLSEMREAGVTRVVLIPLYPQSSFSSSYAVIDAFRSTIAQMEWNPEIAIVDHYYEQPAYVRAIAASIRDAGYDPTSDDRLAMSFHAIPLKDMNNGDTYTKQTEATRVAIARELGMKPDRIAYGMQCVFGGHPERWTGPLTRDILSTWRNQDFGRVFVVLPGFSIDCLETIYDTNQDIVPLFRRQGDGKMEHDVIRVPCLNDSDAHVDVMMAVLKPYLMLS